MVAIIDSFLAAAGPTVEQIIGLVVQLAQLIGLLLVMAYGYMLWKYDTFLNIRELSKGHRTITTTTRATGFKEKKTGTPKLRMFGTFGFRGEVIDLPPTECLVAHRSRVTTKMYDFVKKDGLYHPIENLVLGIKKEIINKETGEKTIAYSIEGSGLELSRDYDREQAIQNTLIEKATVYRNRKPTEIIASFALMIITIIVSGVVMWFAWKNFGNIAGAIASLGPPLREGLIVASQGVVGPG